MDNKYSNLSFNEKDLCKLNKPLNIVKTSKIISCKGIYLFIAKGVNYSPAINYSVRSFFFFKLLNFFKSQSFNLAIILRIFNKEFKNIWYLFLHEFSIKIYVILLLKIINSYDLTFGINYADINTTNIVIRPSSHLIHNNFSFNNDKVWCNKLKLFKQYLNLSSEIRGIDVFRKLRQQKFWMLQYNETSSDQFNKNYIIHFLRVQRRYNKRRYSRVRAISRPPFFAGISLSSIFVASFWNSSIKSVDWLTSLIVVIDVNLVLAVLIFYFLSRLYRVYNMSVFIRQRGKSRIVYILDTLFSVKYFIKFFK